MPNQFTEISISHSRLETEIYCHHFCSRTNRFMQRNSLFLSVLVSKIKYFVLDLDRWRACVSSSMAAVSIQEPDEK